MNVSVIVPTLARPAALHQTLQSIARCSPLPEEVIVVDGDSEGSAKPVAKEHQGGPLTVSYVQSEPGLTKQRTIGMRRASGDILVFFDDDVVVSPDVFALLKAAYGDPSLIGATGKVIEPKAPRIVGKHSRVRRLLPGGAREGAFTRYGYPRRIVDVDAARDTELMHGSFMSARAEVAREVGFDESLPGYGLAEDEDFSYRLARRGGIRYLPAASIQHLKLGHGARDARAFGRQLVINRAYLFRKNFRTTPLARAQFCMLIGLLLAHRALNREWQEFVGLLEGSAHALREGNRAPQAPRVTGAVKVMFVSSHAKKGGSERFLEDLVGRLEDEWVSGVVCLEDGPLAASLRKVVEHVTVLPASTGGISMLLDARKLRSEIKRTSPMLIHANGVKAALLAAVATTGTGLPVVWLKHDFSYDGVVARIIAARCRRVVGVSNAVTLTLRRSRDKVRVIPVGMEPSPVDRVRGRRALVEAAEISSDGPVVGLVGRLHPVKGHEVVLDIAPDLLARFPTLSFVFVGGPDPAFPTYQDRLTRRAHELAVADRIRWLGYREDLAGLLSGMDLIVVPSGASAEAPGREGFSIAALESMAAGTPVVGFDAGGLPEVLGPCGLIVAFGDREALREAIAEVLDDEDLASELARCGLERVEKQFSPDDMVRRLQAVYMEAAR